MAVAEETGPETVLAELAGCRAPFLIGVRHHSPALAAALPEMLAAADPEVLLVELPEEFAQWLEHLGDPATVPPVALAGSGEAGGLVFLPFAEFSPELAAVRWAREAGVPVVPFDLPLAERESARGRVDDEPAVLADDEPSALDGDAPSAVLDAPSTAPLESPSPSPVPGRLVSALRARAGLRAEDDLWDRLVESAAPGGTAEALRRAALLVGWALRADGGEVTEYDLAREAHMRRRLAEHAGRRTAAVVGAFHAPALTAPDDATPRPTPSGAGSGEQVATSLVPYAYPLLDERSGYPAGIRDPEWQRGVFRAGGDAGRIDALLTDTAVRVCAAVRAAGHPSGPADAREVVRVARDLATLRGLPAPGRGELVEAAQTVLTQGQLLGRGRVVAAAMEQVLVGDRRGRLAPGTPRSGLGPAVEALLGELRLPGPDAPARRELRLDPHRSELDRRREILLRRLAVCHVPYGEEGEVAQVGEAAPLTTRWTVEWSPSAAAMLDVAGIHGVTLEQATTGLLRRRHMHEVREGGPTAEQVLAGLTDAARCALPELAGERLVQTAESLPASGTLPELLTGLDLLSGIEAGRWPGLPPKWRADEVADAREELGAAGARALDGLAGSTEPADARALVDLAVRAGEGGGGLRLADALARLAAEGTPLIRGAAGTARVLLGQADAAEFGVRLASRVDSAESAERRAELSAFLQGTLVAAGPLLETGRALDPLLERVESLTDRAFLDRLPALRGGFDTLSPAARARMLAAVEDRTGLSADTLPAAVADPALLAWLAEADLAGREALMAAGLADGMAQAAYGEAVDSNREDTASPSDTPTTPT
ncbi:DUF5682 family protein, partial [Streptomyces luteocolor]|uniref:DUF5682 family protein n=1 Tax=Streptomyces luteocolor TaxID=285500 RepID=UPI001EDA36C5